MADVTNWAAQLRTLEPTKPNKPNVPRRQGYDYINSNKEDLGKQPHRRYLAHTQVQRDEKERAREMFFSPRNKLQARIPGLPQDARVSRSPGNGGDNSGVPQRQWLSHSEPNTRQVSEADESYMASYQYQGKPQSINTYEQSINSVGQSSSIHRQSQPSLSNQWQRVQHQDRRQVIHDDFLRPAPAYRGKENYYGNYTLQVHTYQ